MFSKITIIVRRNLGLLRASALGVAALTVVTIPVVLAGRVEAAPLITQGFYIDTAGINCGAATTFCTLSFPVVPAGKVLVVRSASCNASVLSTSVKIQTSYLFGSGKTTHLEVGAPLIVSTVTKYTFNNVVLAPVTAGQSPGLRIFLTAAAGSSMSCTISGELKP
jgi:hypothetical protein